MLKLRYEHPLGVFSGPRLEDVKAESLAFHMSKVGLVSTFLAASLSSVDILSSFLNTTLHSLHRRSQLESSQCLAYLGQHLRNRDRITHSPQLSLFSTKHHHSERHPQASLHHLPEQALLQQKLPVFERLSLQSPAHLPLE